MPSFPLVAKNICVWTPPGWEQEWLAGGITERGGGVSAGAFASLNLGLHVGDDADAVRENRERAAETLGFSLGQMVCAAQVHGANAAVAYAQERGRGAAEYGDAIPDADALVTRTPGTLLALFFADCVPILLADPKRRVVAVAHGGWRGLAAGILPNTVRAMMQIGSEPQDLLAAVGPCISAAHFEVGEEVAACFPSETRRECGPKPHVDLPAVAVRQLRDCGLKAENIALSGLCTASEPERFFSHRASGGKTGRFGAFIGIR